MKTGTKQATDAKEKTSALARAFLSRQKQSGAPYFKSAVFLTFAGGGLLIAQCRVLAVIVNGVVFGKTPLPQLSASTALLLALIGLRAVLGYCADMQAFQGAERVTESLKQNLLKKIAALGPALLGTEPPGSLVSTMTGAVDALHPYYARYITGMALAGALPLAILLLVFPVDWISGLILLVTAPLIPAFMILIGKGAEEMNRRQWRKLTYMGGYFLDAVQGLTTLKLFRAGKRETARIAQVCEDYRIESMRPLRVAFLSSLVLEFLATVSIAMVAVLVGFRLMWGDIAFLPGFFVLLLTPEFYLPLRRMGSYYHIRMDAMAAAEKIDDLLSLPQRQKAGQVFPQSRKITLRFDHVALRHEDKTVLENATFDIPAGDCIALTGASGAGKTSLLNLLLKFMESANGSVFANGRDLSTLEPQSWRRHIAWAPQKPHLFQASLMENLCMGQADVDIAQLQELARDFAVDEIAETLPCGYDTVLGDGGARLSGGEIQRIALLRAFLRPAPLLLLDEPTAHLDPAMRGRIRAAIFKHAEGRTVVTATHQPDDIMPGSTVYRLENGRLTLTAEEAGHARHA
jgi:ATP-binding cassette subfamily C protein CydD